MDTYQPSGLPVEAILADLCKALQDHTCTVLQAPPGAGKTTCIPLALRTAAWLRRRKIMMLAPRRLAARAAAMRMSDLLNEKVGHTVGYRVRMDSCVSAATRIEVVTEGVLTRMLQSDPSLEGIGLIIFDEFHERSLDADLGLALCLDIQGVLNADIRVLIMSATIDTRPVAALLGNAPVIECQGREYPVETLYVGHHTPSASVDSIYEAILTAISKSSGDILVFLPGAPEIRQVMQQLKKADLGSKWILAPLFGNLSRREQDQAIAPSPKGRRKIVLATSIAETSLTIEGIRTVVDCGLQRVPRFDPRSGLTRLVTVPVSQASADQRRGRAGRVGPGMCLRLWSRDMQATLAATHRPEIQEVDLTRLALELALWGVTEPSSLRWLDPPSPTGFKNAQQLLQSLGALDRNGNITAHGKEMATLPVHPRLAHMMVATDKMGGGGTACDLAALLSEREVVHFAFSRSDVDMRIRLDLLLDARNNRALYCPGGTVDFAAVRRVVRVANYLRQRLEIRTDADAAVSVGQILAWAYPDRIAQRRGDVRGRFLLVNGQGAFLDATEALAGEAYLIAVELDGARRNARIYRAASYSYDKLIAQFGERTQWVEAVKWDPQRQAVNARRELHMDALVLRSEPLGKANPQQVLTVLIEGIRQQGLQCLPWTQKLRRWQQRVCFLRRISQDLQTWPDVSDDGLASQLMKWLAPFLIGINRLRDISPAKLRTALFSLLSYQHQQLVDELAPTHLMVPSGSRIPIDYAGEVPVLAVRIQELFGLKETPTVAGGRQPLLIHLLSPAGRPVQITQDLANFWQTGYSEVKKELKGRYPKHYWPDDPLKAQATARVKPHGKS